MTLLAALYLAAPSPGATAPPGADKLTLIPVSYTHLTLPTILLV